MHPDDPDGSPITRGWRHPYTHVLTNVIADTTLTPQARYAYTALSMIADGDAYHGGTRGPALNELARLMTCSRDTARRYVNELADAGLITRHDRFDDEGRQLPSAYQLHIRNAAPEEQ